jgi:hypothetical protein
MTNKNELLLKIWQEYQKEKAIAKEANKRASQLIKTFEKILYQQDEQLFDEPITLTTYEHQTK